MKDGRKFIDGAYDIKNAGTNFVDIYNNYVNTAKPDKEAIKRNIELAEQGIKFIKDAIELEEKKTTRTTRSKTAKKTTPKKTEEKIVNQPVEKVKSK